MCLVCSIADQTSGRKKEFLVQESTNRDKNAITNSADLDKNNHNEQSDQSQNCLPS